MELKEFPLATDLDERFVKPVEQLSSRLSNFIAHPEIDSQVREGSENAVASKAVYFELSSVLGQIEELRALINLYHKDAKWEVDNIDALDECMSQGLEIITR